MYGIVVLWQRISEGDSNNAEVFKLFNITLILLEYESTPLKECNIPQSELLDYFVIS